ncbi:unnamed protein product [Dovyalis caffra]|uniref:Uncharacterized protein n=1 Tax=Dovyalis caffra TaxID=77055 RepID=A0AAV1SY60_9ROSI|nr:unnamed protein product [Dovyalis caffra]
MGLETCFVEAEAMKISSYGLHFIIPFAVNVFIPLIPIVEPGHEVNLITHKDGCKWSAIIPQVMSYVSYTKIDSEDLPTLSTKHSAVALLDSCCLLSDLLDDVDDDMNDDYAVAAISYFGLP